MWQSIQQTIRIRYPMWYQDHSVRNRHLAKTTLSVPQDSSTHIVYHIPL